MLSSTSTKFKIYFMPYALIMLMFVFIILMVGDDTIGLITYTFNYAISLIKLEKFSMNI